MMIISVIVKAQDEKTYVRDRSECSYGNSKFNLEIRSPDLYALSSESEYGNSISIKQDGVSRPIIMNESDIGRYRILSIYNKICSKVMAFPVNQSEVAFLLLKDNRPFKDQLTILYYNVKTKLTEVVSTKVSVKEAFLKEGKVFLRHSKDQAEQKFGTLVMDNEKFNFVEKHFEPWMSFDGKHFKTDPMMSYENFEYKHLLDKKVFSEVAQLNKATYQVATRGPKTCLSFAKASWVCK